MLARILKPEPGFVPDGLMPAGWLQPDWPVPPNVRAVFTTRSHGVSSAPWDSMNLGDHVGDRADHVAANRTKLQQVIASRPVFLRQVHGAHVERLSLATPDGAHADACITTARGVACTIMVADCLPVLLASADGRCVAAAHAGWRGLAGMEPDGKVGKEGVLEAVFNAFQALNKPVARLKWFQTAPKIIAWLGPCIGPHAFIVGAEVKAAFDRHQPGTSEFFKPSLRGKYWADLAGLARARLQHLGVTQIYGNDSTPPWCTATHASTFFSHRRDAGDSPRSNGHGTTGRMAASIWLN